MRKIIVMLLIGVLSFVIYGCKPVVPDEIYSYIKYLESYRLRGVSDDFFVEIVLGKKETIPFCDIIFMPKKIGVEVDTIKYIYGVNTGFAKFDTSIGKYKATIDYDKVHTAIFYDSGGGREVVELVALAQECPATELLQKAYEHFKQRIDEQNSNDKLVHKIEIKILADMSGSAFFYVVFFSKNDVFALLFDINNLNIIADYSH